MNLTEPAIIWWKKQAHVIPDQIKEREETQRQHMEVVVLQTQTKFEQQLVNVATSSGGSIPEQIPATIVSTVTKEEMIQMFTKFTQNFQQG